MEEISKSEQFIANIFITEKEDIQLIKDNLESLPSLGELLSIKDSPNCPNTWDVQIMFTNPTQLYLLGRYIGCDRKRIHDLDF